MKSAAHQYEDKLLEFAYGELAQHEADAVDAHVRGCARCAQSLTEIRAVRASMAQLPRVAVPDAGLESLLAYAEQAAQRSARPAPPFWKRVLTPLASVMALVTVGVIAFRANQEFDTSPASAAADETVKARTTSLEQQAAQAEGKKTVIEDEKPAEVPAALAAAAPAENKQEQKALAGKLDDLTERRGKRGDGWSPKPSPLQSSTRRANQAKDSLDEAGSLADDYANARGGLAKAARPAPPPAPEPGQDKNVGYGLSGGRNAPSGLGSGAPPATPAPAREESYRAKTEAGPAPAPSAAPATGSKKAKNSISLKEMGSSSYGSAEEDAAVEKSDSLGVDRDAKFAERQRSENRTQSLESARVASSRGDRLGEIKLLTQVLQGGATGYERVEALKRLCDAYEALGEYDRADPFCDQLLSEFPNTVAARVVSDRRQRVQRAPAPKSSAPARMESEQRKAADLEQPTKRPAEAVPAQAY